MNNNIKKLLSSSEMIVFFLIVVLSLVIGFVNSAFFGVPTIISLLRAMLVTLIFAVCEMIVIVSGGIDVSFPAVASTAMYATTKIMTENGIDNLAFAFLFAAFIGILFGLFNGFLIVQMKIPPLIATLGVSSIANGGTLAFLGSKEISRLPSSLDAVSKMFLFTYESSEGIKYSLTVLFLIPIVLCIAASLMMKFTMLGRSVYAIGGDENAARVAGVNVKLIKYVIYIFSGCFAGIAGITYAILMRQANPQVLMGSEMMVIAAVVVGGTRITGGHGTVIGTILGVGVIALVQNNLIMLGVPTHFQTFVVGLIIVLGTSITSLRAKYVARNAKQ